MLTSHANRWFKDCLDDMSGYKSRQENKTPTGPNWKDIDVLESVSKNLGPLKEFTDAPAPDYVSVFDLKTVLHLVNNTVLAATENDRTDEGSEERDPAVFKWEVLQPRDGWTAGYGLRRRSSIQRCPHLLKSFLFYQKHIMRYIVATNHYSGYQDINFMPYHTSLIV